MWYLSTKEEFQLGTSTIIAFRTITSMYDDHQKFLISKVEISKKVKQEKKLKQFECNNIIRCREISLLFSDICWKSCYRYYIMYTDSPTI